MKILFANCCRLDHNYSGRNGHPQSHLCKASCMSIVEQVSCARTCKVSPGSFIPLCHHDPKYTKVCNNIIINAHIHMCSNRTKHLHIDTALIPLKGSLQRKQKFSYGCNHKNPRSYLGDASNGQTVVRINSPLKTQNFVNENGSRGWCRGSLADLKIVKMCAAIQLRSEFRHTYGLMTTSFPRSSGAAEVEDPW